VQSSPYSNPGDGPVITFIDDDGNPLWFDIWGPICAAQGITMSLALITGRVSGAIVDPTYASVTLAQAQSIEALGHDILCHSYSHISSDTSTVAALDADWLAGQEWMQANFPACADVLVYPGGLATADVAKKNVARKYFRYGIATNNINSYNVEPLDSWLGQRVNADVLTEAELKAKIDATVTANGWLVILTHSYELNASGQAASITKLNNVIDYAQAASVPILPWSAAEKLKGNAVAIGEFTDPAHRTFVSHMGKQVASVDMRGKFSPTLYGSTTTGTHTYTTQTGFYDVVGGMAFVRVSLRINAAVNAAVAGSIAAVNIVTGGDLVVSINGAANITIPLATGDTPTAAAGKVATAVGADGSCGIVGGIFRLSSTRTGPTATVTIVSGTGTVLADLALTAGQTNTGSGWDTSCAGALKIGGLPSPALVSTRDPNPPAAVNFNYFNLGAGFYSVWAKFTAANFINLMKNGTGVNENYLYATDFDSTKTMLIDFWAVWMATDERWTVL